MLSPRQVATKLEASSIPGLGRTAPSAPGWQRLIQRAAAWRPASALLAPTLHLVDAPILRLSAGRHSLTRWLTGLPVILVTTIGARTGRPRTTPLVALQDGKRIVLIASSYGRLHQPGWYYNLRRHPHALIALGQLKRSYRAREALAEEREAYWAQAIHAYPGFAAYARRAPGRVIPVIVLTPEDEDAGGFQGG